MIILSCRDNKPVSGLPLENQCFIDDNNPGMRIACDATI